MMRVVVLVLASFVAANIAQANTWKVDPAHTTLGFSVSHLFTSVQGRFDRFEGTIQFDPEHPEATVIRASAEAASVNTNNGKRDKHLRSSDFFDVEKYRTLEFTSQKLTGWSNGSGKLLGTLTIHGVSREVEFDVRYLGRGKDPWGNERAGFKASVLIDRRDYGLKWNETLETGSFLVGNEVEIRIDAEGLLE
jgi:polyisoprenoid-binding protein YceI